MNEINVSLAEQTARSLAEFREGYASWGTNERATNGAILLLADLASEELRLMAPFSETHAQWLVAHTTGATNSPSLVGRVLHRSINSGVPYLGNPGGQFRMIIAALTLTQDWALRMTLARYHSLRRTDPGTTLASVGFPIHG